MALNLSNPKFAPKVDEKNDSSPLIVKDVGYKDQGEGGAAVFLDKCKPDDIAVHMVCHDESGFSGMFLNATPVNRGILGTTSKEYSAINLNKGVVEFFTGEIIERCVSKKKYIGKNCEVENELDPERDCDYEDKKYPRYGLGTEYDCDPDEKCEPDTNCALKRIFKPRRVAFYDNKTGEYTGCFNHVIKKNLTAESLGFKEGEVVSDVATEFGKLKDKIKELEDRIKELESRI